MKAAVVASFGAHDCINVLRSQDIPKLEKAGQILVRVFASGVNPVDTYIRSGQYAALPRLPYTIGRDGAGEVANVAADVKDFKKGDRVWFLSGNNGSAAEYVIPTHVFSLPKDITYTEGAALGIPYLTAYRALFMKYPLEKDATVLIHGASGGVGLAACQLAAWKGHNVVGTAGTPEGCANVLRNGASMVYNHREEHYDDKIKEAHSKGFDLIIEMAAHINLNTDLSLLAKNGRIAVVGNRGETQINARFLMTMESVIFGVSLVHSTASEYKHMSHEITQMLTKTNFRPIVHKEYALDEIAQAHYDIMNNGGAKGNLIVRL